MQDAIKKNPTLMEARHKSSAAGKSLNIAYSKLLPKVDGEISFNTTDAKSSYNSSGTVYSVTARMPIFQSGAEYTSIKRSRHVKDASKYEISRLESLVRANAINAWNNYVISKDVLVNRKASIDSDQKALDGVSEEAKMGTRTTIEVLDSRKNLYQSQLAYQDAISRHLEFCYTIQQLLVA